MKNITLLSLFFIALFSEFSGFASTTDTIAKNVNKEFIYHTSSRYIPSDTLQRFISKLGKDSLVKLIDSTIAQGSRVIIAHEDKLINSSLAYEIKQVGKQFGLGFDTLLFKNAPDDFPLFKMYNRYFGEDSLIFWLNNYVDSLISKSEMNFLMKDYYNSIQDSRIQKFLLLYCDKFNIDDKILDTIYNMRINYPTKQKIETYFYFAEISRSCPGKYKLADSLKTVLFLSLYEKLKLSDLAYENKELSVKNELSFNLIYRIKFLAYALYTGDFNFKSDGSDLIRLLSLQDKKTGGWKEYNYKADILYYPSTFYAIWALCEFKQSVLNYK